MITFHVVRCPRCETVVMEIATGLSRGRCPNPKCKARVMAGSDGRRVEVLMVDSPLRRVAESA